jgi:AraC-like DNA-binding protein
MTMSYPSIFGNERRQTLDGLLSESRRALLEQFVSCRLELIRSTHWLCDPPWFVPRRIINNDYFLFVLDGALEMESPQGKKVLKRGDFFYTAPGEPHSFGFTGDLNHVEHILVHCRVFLPGLPLQRRLFNSSFLRLPNPDIFLKQLRHLPYLWESSSPAAQGCTEALLKTLFMDLSRNEKVTFPAAQAPADSRIVAALAFMHRHQHDDLSVESIATASGLSLVHFRRLFRRATGRTPLDFLTGLRLQEACRRLENTRQKVKEIAMDCGFRDVDYFCRLFKQRQGCTPSAYRRNLSLM